MYYSLTFGDSTTRNTWTNWKLVPESPPTIPSPKPVTNYVDIPGRIAGPIDLTKALFNRTTYERITGSWTFAIYEDYWTTANPKTTFNTIRSFLHGRVTKVVFEEDPDHYFYGRFTVDPPNRDKTPFALKIGYDLEPVRYNTNGSVDTGWIK